LAAPTYIPGGGKKGDKAEPTNTEPKGRGIIKDINRREYFLLLALLIPTVILGIFPNVLLDSLHFSVSSLLYFI
jgi:NADH:ubiquinone oxidoreductase subunit 4 (subunit M)